MAVQEQTPLQEYTANGIAKQFDLEFDCESADHLIVSIDDLEVLHTDWYLSGNAITFHIAPANGKQVKIQRNTPFNRLADYQSYNNSFRPPAINKDFDRIWWKLQELGVADWILSNRINALKAYVDDRDDELRAYLMEEIRKQGVALDQLDEYYNYLMQRLAQIAVDKGWDASFVVSASGETQQEINDYIGADWRVKAGGYDTGDRARLLNGDIVKSLVDNNTSNPNEDMTGWVNLSSVIVKPFYYFNEDFVAAANWIKESTANYVELPAKEYTLPTGDVYFNRFFCRNGSVTIHVPATTYLQYGSFANDEVLHLEGVDYIVDGHRRDAYSTGYVLLYTTRTTEYICKTAFIERVSVYGMKDGSYVDDVGKTRAEGFIDYGVTEFSHINDIKTYGVCQFATIRPFSENAQHFERNFTGVNCETGIYYPRGLTWLSGDTEDMQIINTLAQREYWSGMSAGRVNNGMDVIMNEASYATKYRLRKVYAKCAIERSIYVMSDNADVADIEDVESDTIGACKSEMLTPPLTRVRAENFRARDIKNTGYKLGFYGSDNIIIDGFDYSQAARDGSRFISITNTNYCELRNFSVSNINQLVYYTPESSSNKIKLINFNVKDCYASNVYYVFGQASGGNSIGELYFDNFKMSVPQNITPADIYYQAIDARKISRFIAKNCHFYINLGLYQYDSSLTYAELTDVKVSVITSATLNSIFSALSNSTNNYIAANIFDVLIDIKSTVTPSVKTQIKCVKQADNGLANCAQNWKDISLEIPVTTAPASYPLFSFGAASYFVDVEFAGSIMRYFYNATTNTITEQVNAGGKLATGAPQVDKITFNVSAANNYRIDIAVGAGTWSGGAGTLRVKIHR